MPPLPPGHRPLARRMGILLVLIQLTGCYTWQAASGPVSELLADDPPSRIRVELVDGTEREVSQPLVFGDTLFAQRSGQRPDPVAAVDEVQHVDVPRTDAIATGLAVVGIPIVLLGVLVVAVGGGPFTQ